jgi:hypothetical protein
MALSGDYSDFMQIEFALRAQGFHEARGQLDNPAVRQYLNDLCAQARNGKSNA